MIHSALKQLIWLFVFSSVAQYTVIARTSHRAIYCRIVDESEMCKGNYIIQYLSIRFSEELTLGGLGGLDSLTVQKLHSKGIKPRIMYRMELNRG